jgi:hypothetical protein
MHSPRAWLGCSCWVIGHVGCVSRAALTCLFLQRSSWRRFNGLPFLCACVVRRFHWSVPRYRSPPLSSLDARASQHSAPAASAALCCALCCAELLHSITERDLPSCPACCALACARCASVVCVSSACSPLPAAPTMRALLCVLAIALMANCALGMSCSHPFSRVPAESLASGVCPSGGSCSVCSCSSSTINGATTETYSCQFRNQAAVPTCIQNDATSMYAWVLLIFDSLFLLH